VLSSRTDRAAPVASVIRLIADRATKMTATAKVTANREIEKFLTDALVN
jgi:hypothetical protein